MREKRDRLLDQLGVPRGQTNSPWIYAAQEGDAPLVKIGLSYNVMKRILGLQSHERCTLALCGVVPIASLGAYAVEREVHRQLASQRITGEWFYLSMTQSRLEGLVSQAVEILAKN